MFILCHVFSLILVCIFVEYHVLGGYGGWKFEVAAKGNEVPTFFSIPWPPFRRTLLWWPSSVRKVLRPKDYDTSVTSVLFDASPTPSGFSRNGGCTISRDNIGAHRIKIQRIRAIICCFLPWDFGVPVGTEVILSCLAVPTPSQARCSVGISDILMEGKISFRNHQQTSQRFSL